MMNQSNKEKNLLDDGYYLAIYSYIDPILNILRTSVRTDHNMALFKKEQSKISLIHHWEFERITGYKHHPIAFYDYENAIEFINERLSPYNLKFGDIKQVIGTNGLATIQNYYINEEMSAFPYHSICHIFSSMFSDTSLFDKYNVIGLALDGGPDLALDYRARNKSFYCSAVMKKNNLTVASAYSPAIYWLMAANYFHKPEGTLMALAYASKAASYEDFGSFVKIYDIKGIREAQKQFDFILNKIMNYTRDDIGIKCSEMDERFSWEDNKISMLMKILQEESILQVSEQIQVLLDQYELDPKETYLSPSGGYALNCPTNTYLMQKFKFKGMVTCPCVNDSGISIGMSLHYFYQYNNKMEFKLDYHSYGNFDYDLQLYLENSYYSSFIDKVEYGLQNVADDLIHEPIIWFHGRAEIGPRALGNRSILGDPRNKKTKDLLNTYKQREWWRPVAPVVLEEYAHEWFEEAFPSPYMLNNFKVKADKRESIEAVLHLDDTARVQTVSIKSDAVLYGILLQFYKRTGVPVLANTSLNDKGEPIINNIDEALNFALRKKIRIVYINDARIVLKNHDQYVYRTPLIRNIKNFSLNFGNEKLLEKYNPFNLSKRELVLYKRFKELGEYDIEKEKDCAKIKRLLDKIEVLYFDDLVY